MHLNFEPTIAQKWSRAHRLITQQKSPKQNHSCRSRNRRPCTTCSIASNSNTGSVSAPTTLSSRRRLLRTRKNPKRLQQARTSTRFTHRQQHTKRRAKTLSQGRNKPTNSRRRSLTRLTKSKKQRISRRNWIQSTREWACGRKMIRV